MRVVIRVDSRDFQELYTACMQWSGLETEDGLGWKAQEHRFHTYKEYPWGECGEINWDYKKAYWFDNPVNMIIAREYLAERAEPYQILVDQLEQHDPLLILTDYEA